MLFNEPKLLKYRIYPTVVIPVYGFSALQRAEIAEIYSFTSTPGQTFRFSALQRAEIAEIFLYGVVTAARRLVSVLFNEPKLLKSRSRRGCVKRSRVSVLFNEPKLLKSSVRDEPKRNGLVSVLFNEPKLLKSSTQVPVCQGLSAFQCSSTSRNC